MSKCSFCKEILKDKKFKYCFQCRVLYEEMQKSLPKELRELDSNLVHRRKFKYCSLCNEKLSLPKYKFCMICNQKVIHDAAFKTAVRNFTNLCLANKWIPKGKKCEKCDSSVVDCHHVDYMKPLEVRWLCQFHHTEEHVQLRKGLKENEKFQK